MDVPPPTTPGAGGHRPMLPRYTPHAFAVAGDATRRNVLEMRLRRQGYVVTPCSDPVVAMAVLRDRRGGFDLVVVDMSPPRSGALELFECAIREMRVHAYAMSQVGNFYGPLAMDDLDTFRQPITSKAYNESRSSEAMPNSHSDGSVTATASTITTTSSPGRRATRRWGRRQPSETGSQEVEQDREHGEVQQQQPDQRPKKARLVWTPELHSKFVDAHNKLLPGDAVPKKILKLMNDATLTRENIASHLQKYRLNLKETEPQPLHRANPRTKYHRTAPSQASFLSPDMSQQKEIVMACRAPEAAAFYMNYGFNAQTVIGAPAVSDMQNNRPELHMQAFEAVNMNKECRVDTVHARDESTGRGTVPKEMYTGARVEHDLDVEPKPVTADSHNNSDGSFQEDLSKTIQQTLNKDPGPSWDYEFLHHSA